MYKIYLTQNGQTTTIDEPVKDCWINMIHPTDKECQEIAERYSLDIDDVVAALDEEESPRIEVEDNYVMVIVDIPTNEERNGKNRYVTIPLSVIITPASIITICLEKTAVLDFQIGKRISNIDTSLKTRFLLKVLLANAKLYLTALKDIYKQSETIESHLKESTENPALIDMMELGKSLLYFSTSLKANSIVLDKLIKTEAVKKYEEDADLLEDVIIENKQAADTTEIYSGIINGTMDAYASIIANNMNVVMKVLAVATIILSIPNIIFGAYGMNLAVGSMPFATSPYAFWIIIIISIIASIGVLIYFRKKEI